MIFASFLLLAAIDSAVVHDIVTAPGEWLQATSTGTSGPPIVLIPGLFGGAYGYRNLVAPLAERGFRVIIVEPLGTGFSGYPKDADYSLTAQADRIARALDTLGVRNALLVGHSVGVSMALRLAYRRPELVRGVLAIDGGPIEDAATPGLKHAMRWAGLMKLFMGQGTLRKKLRHGMMENSADSSWITDEVMRGYTAGPARDLHRTIDILHAMARSHEPEQLHPHLSGVRVPVQLLVGTVPHKSGVMPVEIADFKQGLPSFTVDSVAGVGQFIHEERPAAVIDAIVGLDRRAH